MGQMIDIRRPDGGSYAGAQHAFMNETRPEVYDAKVAMLAWERTLKFFERTLKAC